MLESMEIKRVINPMSRLKAASLHLIISLFVVILILTAMLKIWYPGNYFKLMGGNTLIYLISGVDVFLGPLLTLIIFKPGKKSLKFDLLCIALMQITAMSYGLYVMFEARPVFTVFNKNAFYVASEVDIVPSELAKGKRVEWRSASISGPRLVAATAKNSNNKLDRIFFETESQIGAAQQYPRYYDDYATHLPEVIKAGKLLTTLADYNTENKQAINKFLKTLNRPTTDFIFLPINSAAGSMAAILDAKNGDFLTIIDVKTNAINKHSVKAN